MPVKDKKPVVIDPENVVGNELSHPEHFVHRIDVQSKDKERNSFLVLKSSTLNNFANSLIEESLDMGNLRAVFILVDTNPDVFFDKVQELDTPELLRKLFRVTSIEQINRILHSWCDKRESLSIASAFVEGDELVVQSCDLTRYRVKFSDFAGFSKLPKTQRAKFKIDRHGHQISWIDYDLSLDLDVIRYKVDYEFRNERNMAALSDYESFLGEAIKVVMKKNHLTQTLLKNRNGPSERHLYRIETGQQELNSKMIERLASAHELSTEDYIEQLISACDEIAERETNTTRKGIKR